MFSASVGHVNPHNSAAIYAWLQPCFFLLQAFYENNRPIGQRFPLTIAVYVHCWCAIFEHDGSELMFGLAIWYVFGFGWA